MNMEKSVCSEEVLCDNCVTFIKAVSARSTGFTPTGSSADEGRWLWPPSDACQLCNMLNDPKPEGFSITPGWSKHFETDSIFIKYIPTDGSTGGTEPDAVCRLSVNSARGFGLSIAVWCDDEVSSSASGITKTPPLSSDKCPEAFELVRAWLQECQQNHEECLYSISGLIVDETCGPDLPTRVLDICKWTDGVVSLVETSGKKGNFCALSYCWGKEGHNMTSTKETITSRCAGISMDLLPQTFKDAIRLTSEIGIKYLWIDALCIIQDDHDDWEREARDMAQVYQNACLVIAADGASHPGEGCFVRENIYPTAAKVPLFDHLGRIAGSIWLSRLLGTWETMNPSNGPLQKRGWALQETYLARRSVHFMPGGMGWKCEEMEIREHTSADFQFYREDWELLLQSYSRRDFTYKKDRLFAIQGLASAFEKREEAKYHMGVLSVDIDKQLMWTLRNSASPLGTLVDVPSWSWACLEGDKAFLSRVAWNQWLEPRAALEENGVIKFTGYLGKCHIDRYQGISDSEVDPHRRVLHWVCTDYLRRPDWKVMHSRDPTSQPIGFAATDQPFYGSCFIAFLGEAYWESISNLVNEWETFEDYPTLSNHPSRQLRWVLLLVPSSEKEGAFRRVGTGAVWRDPEDGATRAQQVTVELV